MIFTLQDEFLPTFVCDVIVAAFGQSGYVEQAFHAFDTFFQELQLQPTPDSYAAVLSASIENNVLISVPLVSHSKPSSLATT